ncbi:hypothetical protein TNCV_349821 [Trichonephila clavipes]|nr:hypothetical protein TNCV_349821 [Trichonephila clavipes]
MPLNRMENTTSALPSIIDSHDMGLRTVFTVRTPKGKRLFNAAPLRATSPTVRVLPSGPSLDQKPFTSDSACRIA